MNRETILSPCRRWRYTLWREWDSSRGYALFIGLNPAEADETTDDRTIRREMDFAQRWGYDALAKWNLFGFRTPYPYELRVASDPIGEDNDLPARSGAGGRRHRGSLRQRW